MERPWRNGRRHHTWSSVGVVRGVVVGLWLLRELGAGWWKRLGGLQGRLLTR